MTTPRAKTMGEALRHMANLLSELDVVEPATYAHIDEAATALISQGNNTTWWYQVDLSRPIIFVAAEHPKYGTVHPRIAAHISVKQGEPQPPFDTLKLALEITDSAGDPIQRWHVDRANQTDGEYQEGPLYHLQIGGHWRGGDRTQEVLLSEPRWCHPPLDTVLLTEIVTANFYPAHWRSLHTRDGWRAVVRESQKLCYTAYVAKMSSALSIGTSTALAEMWARTWGHAER